MVFHFYLRASSLLLLSSCLTLTKTRSVEINQDATAILPFSLSMIYLSRLAEKEAQIYRRLKNIASPSEQLNATFQEYMMDYEQSKDNCGHWKVEQHPLLAYRMIRRFVKDIPRLIRSVHSNYDMDTPDLQFPTRSGLDSVAEAVVDIQSNLRLPVSELIHGKFGEFDTRCGLTIPQATEFAKHISHMDHFVQAWEWLEYLDKLSSTDKQMIDTIRQDLISRHDEKHDITSNAGDMHIFLKPLKYGVSPWRKDVEMTTWLTTHSRSGTNKELFFRTYALCSNSSLTFPVTPSRHVCRLTISDAYMTLAPAKVEVLSLNPNIMIFHDVIRDAHMASLWKAGTKEIEENSYYPGSRSLISNIGTISGAPLGTMFSTLEKLTGLNVSGVGGRDSLGVTQYVLSGNAGVHQDAYDINVGGKPVLFGDRLATLILYMNDVTFGGETVFPGLNLKVRPTKGSVLFWPNYKRNGNIEWRTKHAVCPPILGQKRIATGFVGIKENIFKRQCSLDPDE